MNKIYEIAKRICEENNIPPQWESAIIACCGGLFVDRLPVGYVLTDRAKELRE
jgi:hypothetical protein